MKEMTTDSLGFPFISISFLSLVIFPNATKAWKRKKCKGGPKGQSGLGGVTRYPINVKELYIPS